MQIAFITENTHAETRTYVGETGTRAHDRYAGFGIGLSYTKEFDEVRLALPHGSLGAAPLILSVWELEEMFRK